jgi:hypothetical protein
MWADKYQRFGGNTSFQLLYLANGDSDSSYMLLLIYQSTGHAKPALDMSRECGNEISEPI